ncbi:electron transport complex protein RnfE [Marinitoga hydrogenitolerans DSM 16785]|uniref:Ion-translocating oxidoreductase complex subunit E n=1 Tax=Marinitoga hydrogenitolerans (strain DSM 16785 / JCM 12826 / AT1271) TaxID=1122195 RepID=A0A1M4W0D4_MARH1|nr:electron transport complex subunit E [Marinitoga hydrogenitolerans]SHE74708.1 electron transport complex protein RnfE [Marinitoga hydrogenitolerans DSM 16785]
MANIKNLKVGLFEQNPIFVQVLGMCPTLATTTNAENALGMGLATLAVLIMSNIVVSSIKKWVPKNIRIPIYIVVIASFVTMIDLLMHGYTYDLWKTLGLFIPLIVVNCIILGRAESFASKNTVLDSIYDALGMGLGFTGALVLLGSVRELLGNGTIFGLPIWGDAMKLYIMILPPGAFLVLGMLLAMFNAKGIYDRNKVKAGERK